MSKTAHRFPLLLAVLCIAALPVPAFASHAWGTYHWSMSGSSVSLTLGDNVSGVWDTHLRNAEADWDQSTVLTLAVGAGKTRARQCKPAAGNRIEVCNAAYGANGWLGLAQIWLSGGHISQGVAKMNDTYYMNEAEKRHVMCQEVGHGFGLGHTSEDGSSQNTCMDYYQNASDSDTTSTRPNSHDYNQLLSIYNHTHAAGSIASQSLALMPPAMGMIDFAGPEQWGEEVWRSEDGRGRVFALDFGADPGSEHEDGHFMVLTHVFMAGPDNPIDTERPWLRGPFEPGE